MISLLKLISEIQRVNADPSKDTYHFIFLNLEEVISQINAIRGPRAVEKFLGTKNIGVIPMELGVCNLVPGHIVDQNEDDYDGEFNQICIIIDKVNPADKDGWKPIQVKDQILRYKLYSWDSYTEGIETLD